MIYTSGFIGEISIRLDSASATSTSPTSEASCQVWYDTQPNATLRAIRGPRLGLLCTRELPGIYHRHISLLFPIMP